MENKEDDLKPFMLGFYNTKQMMSFYDKRDSSWASLMKSIEWYVGSKLAGNDYSPNQVLKIIKMIGNPKGYYLPKKLQEMVDALPEPVRK